MTEVELVIPGEPVPLQRHRHTRGRTYLPRESVEFRERVQTAWLVEGRPRLDDGPLVLSARFYFGRKDSHVLKNGRLAKAAPVFPPKADIDNLVKSVLDALQDGKGGSFLFADDSQVVTLERCEKLYADRHEEPRTELELRAL